MTAGPSSPSGLPENNDPTKRAVSSIAVALATAICLFPRLYSVSAAIAVAMLAIVAAALARDRVIRTAALFLIGVAVIDLVTFMAAARVGRNFGERSAMHVGREMARAGREIREIEARLNTAAQEVGGEIAKRPNLSRVEMFRLLRSHVGKPGCGMRVIGSNGNSLAWWGEDLRVEGTSTYQFDVTNLYVTLSKPLSNAPLIVQAYERIANQPRAHSLFDPDDDWIANTMFHGGELRLEAGARRYLIEKRADSSLYIDAMPHSRTEIVNMTNTTGRDGAALLLALAAVVIAWQLRRSVVMASILIVVARIALLPLQFEADGWHIFGFDVYASRTLGAFSKSPFDLLLTAAAILAIVNVSSRWAGTSRRARITRTILALAAAAGFIALIRNLVDNSRVSPVPDHIVPISVAQGVLLLALLFFAFAVINIAPHFGEAHRSMRLLITALLAVPLVYVPLQIFETSSAQKFIAETYAPLVIGEAGQLRTMIEDTLRNEFSIVDLSTILPDDYTRMDLQDLAYALWLRSDLSKWRIPAVITVNDIFDHPLSRFGVGLPQFSERRSERGAEVLQVGNLRRVLIHHDFEVTTFGIPIGEGGRLLRDAQEWSGHLGQRCSRNIGLHPAQRGCSVRLSAAGPDVDAADAARRQCCDLGDRVGARRGGGQLIAAHRVCGSELPTKPRFPHAHFALRHRSGRPAVAPLRRLRPRLPRRPHHRGLRRARANRAQRRGARHRRLSGVNQIDTARTGPRRRRAQLAVARDRT